MNRAGLSLRSLILIKEADMRSLFRFLIRMIVLPLAALVLLAIAAFHFIPQSRVRDFAADKIGAKLNRQVILGPVHLNLWGLAVEDLTLSEVPSFRNGVFLTAKDLRLGWSLRMMWEGLDVKKN